MGSLITNENGSRQLYCRYFCLKVLGLDDFIITGALIATTGMAIQNGFHVSLGTGRHTDELPLQQIIIPTLKHWYAYQIVYPFVLYLVKLSILALYHRILTPRNFRLWVWAVSGFITVQTVVVMFVQAFECGSRVDRAWSPTFPEGCNNLAASYYSMSSINVFTDIVILVMPLPTLAKLQINIRKKWALMGIFMTGGVAIAASCLRFYALHVYDTTDDVAYDAIYIEVNMAIITASAPALRPLFKRTFAGSSDRSKYGYYGSARRSHMNAGRGAVELQPYNGKHEAVIAANMAGNDSSSQECILEWGNHRGIVKTVETKVSSGTRSEA
ncbi:hypothetical protein LZ554_004612 [Drepanopeziza brunnea f. sp. 'monogermtubi']|nr:hypothetical protein LZ554_004612 [Drepanopeziza brunnea f. sp. 'monogermtubi']